MTKKDQTSGKRDAILRGARDGFNSAGSVVTAASRAFGPSKGTSYTSTYKSSGFSGDMKKIGGDMHKAVRTVTRGEKAG